MSTVNTTINNETASSTIVVTTILPDLALTSSSVNLAPVTVQRVDAPGSPYSYDVVTAVIQKS